MAEGCTVIGTAEMGAQLVGQLEKTKALAA
jgi:hypothetical protein